MSSKDIEMFFDELAPRWDDMEIKEDKDIIPLLEEVGIKEGDKVLDVGCGTGRITSLLHSFSNAEVVAIDISSKMIEIAKDKYKDKEYARFFAGDFLTYSFKEKFDVIVIYNAFPHFIDKETLKKKLYENLNDGGRFAIIHSLSRRELCDVHNNLNTKTTRKLLSPEDESGFFADMFDIIKAKEDDSSYLIIGRKIN